VPRAPAELLVGESLVDGPDLRPAGQRDAEGTGVDCTIRNPAGSVLRQFSPYEKLRTVSS
jgi:hypothetical protein